MISKQKLEKNLEEKFYHGYDNREELLESIIYFANHELHQEKAKDKNCISFSISFWWDDGDWYIKYVKGDE